jgi:hypothetical protein
VAAYGADQPTQETAHLVPGGAAGGAQHGADGTALAVENNDRLEAVVVVVGEEQAKLLTAVDDIGGVVDVEGDAAWHLAEAGAVQMFGVGARWVDDPPPAPAPKPTPAKATASAAKKGGLVALVGAAAAAVLVAILPGFEGTILHGTSTRSAF